MHCPDPCLSLPLVLVELRRREAGSLLSRIIRSNYHTQVIQTAPEFAMFRNVTADHVGGTDDNALSVSFRKTVPLTTYDSYAPFIARFFDNASKERNLTNLLAPGLPDYIVKSSSTSGGTPKFFPKYDRLGKMRPKLSVPDAHTVSTSLRKRTTAFVSYLWYDPMLIKNNDNHPVKTIYVSSVSAVNRRTQLNLRPEEDREKMSTFILDHAAPYCAYFIKQWRSLLLIHVLFALASRSLETIFIPYTSTFVDMMRHLDAEFDVVVDCIARGIIPDLDGVADVRSLLEASIFPDPERAADLRALGRPSSRAGWCGYAWPNMHSISTTASGSFATYLPLTHWFLGPNVNIRSRGYRCTEAVIALPYNPLEVNQYKLAGESLIEFLDFNKGDSTNALTQMWEVDLGRRYEVVLTTKDGLWRYRLGDVVEITGFDPTDGFPIIQFIERRNMAIRFQNCTVTEKELNTAILSMVPNTTVQVVGWTAMIDYRISPATIGFFVELVGNQISDLAQATQRVLDVLSRTNEKLATSFELESFRKPTIRLVQSGTFSGFLQLKLNEGTGGNPGQVKVPVVLPKAEYVNWFSNRVMQEL